MLIKHNECIHDILTYFGTTINLQIHIRQNKLDFWPEVTIVYAKISELGKTFFIINKLSKTNQKMYTQYPIIRNGLIRNSEEFL